MQQHLELKQRNYHESYRKEFELLEKLSNMHDYTEELLGVILAIKEDVHKDFWDNFINRLCLYLVSYTCQSKYSQYNKPNQQVPMIEIQNKNQSKKLYEYCLDSIIELLLKIINCKKKSREKICELFLEHQDGHTGCLGSMTIFYKVIFFSDKMLIHIRENHIYHFFLEILEKNINKLLKENKIDERSQYLCQNLRNPNTFCDNQDFHTQLSKYVIVNFPQAYKNNSNDQTINSPSKDKQTESELGMIHNLDLKSIHNELTIITENNDKTLKNKVPLLNLPPSSTSEGFATLTRSTRRDPFKSFSTNSNRNSIDSGLLKENKNFQLKNIQDNNISLLDIENSYFYDEKDDKLNKNKTPMDRMRDLAQQLGEYNLTVDLNCLLAQKRRNQLDQVAKIACFQEVDSLMDLKVDENFIKDKIKKRKNNRSQKDHKKDFQLNIQDQLTILESLDLQELTNQESILMSSSREQTQVNQHSVRSNQQINQQLKKLKLKAETIHLRKICKVTANIIFLIIKDLSFEKLELLSSPSNIIYLYISSDLHMRIRKKDALKQLCSRKTSKEYQEIANEINKLNTVCEGIDNLDGINKHYEKIKMDLYKAKMQQFQKYQYSNTMSKEESFQLQHDSDDLNNITLDNNSINDTLNNQSFDTSTEEINLKDNLFNLDHLLLQENVIYYKILGQFSILSERYHEMLSMRKGISYPFFNNKDFINEDNNDENQLDNLQTQKRNLKSDFITIKGQRIQVENINLNDFKNKSNQFLMRFKNKFCWYLNNLDMNSKYYYEIETEQLDILDSYLQNSNSRILCYEIIDHIFEILLMLKRQFIELSLTYQQGKTQQNSVRVQTPFPQNSSTKSSINSAKQPFYIPASMQQHNNYMNIVQPQSQNSSHKPSIKLSIGSRMIIDSPSKNNNDDNNKNANINTSTIQPTSIPFIIKHKDLFGLYLSCLGRIVLKTPRIEVYKLLNQVYFKNEQWRELIKIYSNNLFNDILFFCQDKNDKDIQIEYISLFQNAQRLLFYMKSILIMCQNLILKEKLNEKKNEKSKEWKSFIRKTFQDFMSMVKPSNGVFAKFLQQNQNINRLIISNCEQKLPFKHLLTINLYKEIFQFLNIAFSFSKNYSCLLNEDIACFYLKYCFVNFVKLYSHCNINELNEISKKIKEANIKKNQKNFKDNIDNILNKENYEQSKIEKYYQFFKINLLNSYIKVLFSLSTVRSDEITIKFYQYRVVEFLTREIDLEFDVIQIRERFLRIRKESKEQQIQEEQKKDSPPKTSSSKQQSSDDNKIFQKPKNKVPILNLGGKKDDNTQNNKQIVSQSANMNLKQIQTEDIKEENYNKQAQLKLRQFKRTGIPKVNLPLQTQESHEQKGAYLDLIQNKQEIHKRSASNFDHRMLTSHVNHEEMQSSDDEFQQFECNVQPEPKSKQIVPILKLGSNQSPQDTIKPKIPNLNFKLTQINKQEEKPKNLKVQEVVAKQDTVEDIQQQEMKKSNFKMQLVIDNQKITREKMNINAIQQHLHQIQKIKKDEIQSKQSIQFEPQEDVNVEDLLNENIFYYSERRLKKIYHDQELHANIIALIISLLLTPQRGTLDETYCSQNPIIEGKPNILFILHYHLNHPSNQYIIPHLLEKMSLIKPFPAGQRMLKLLCTALTDMSMYTDWEKINSGAYGVIFEAKTNLPDIQTVAIKQMAIPSNIYSRCVLHDIFSEITCLEKFRLDPCVTDLYDYGVTKTDYVIVMKKYSISLKDWRLKQKGNWQDNLPTYLTIYKDILKSVQLLHSHNVIHYDIKADNILLDNVNNNLLGESNLKVVLGDFGECRLFTSEQDEYCLISRGTEYIKSPEMLTLAISSKKENDKYDRRKKVGTTRTSDIWSLGCLLYEILAGEFLFYQPEWAQFYTKVTSNTIPLLTDDKIEQIGKNIYIIDFLKFIFVREQNLRPNIDSVLKRFEHIHALLVSTTNPVTTYSSNSLNSPSFKSLQFNQSFEQILESYENLLQPHFDNSPEKDTFIQITKHKPTFLKIMDEIYLCTKSFFQQNKDNLILQGITHVVTKSNILEINELNRFHYFQVMVSNETQNKQNSSKSNAQSFIAPSRLAHKVIDYMREIFLYRGKVIFVEDDQVNVNFDYSKLILRNTLLYCLTYFFKCSVYETWSLINSQVLFFQIPFSSLRYMSNCISHLFKIENHIDSFPKSQCICGCTTFVLKRNYNTDIKRIQTKVCNCTKQNKSNELLDCPGDGCQDYLKFIRKRYKLCWDGVKWGYMQPNQFYIGPFNSGQISEDIQIQLILCSEGPSYNCIPHRSNIQKKEESVYQMQVKQFIKKPKENDWTVYKCRVCQMWMFALNSKNSTIAFVLNNLIKRNRQGIMIPNHQQNYKIKTPVLRQFNLYELK